MPTNRPDRNRWRWLAALVVAVGLVAGWHASALAQTRAASGGAAGSAAVDPKPGPARPAPPKENTSPDFIPSETVSSDKPVSFPTDI